MDDFIRVMLDATRDGMPRREIISRCVSALYNHGYRIVQTESRDHTRAVRSAAASSAGPAGRGHVIDRWLAQQDGRADLSRHEAPVDRSAEHASPTQVAPAQASRTDGSPTQASRRPAPAAMWADHRPPEPHRRSPRPRMILIYLIATTAAALLAYSVISTPPRVSQTSGAERGAPMINWGGATR